MKNKYHINRNPHQLGFLSLLAIIIIAVLSVSLPFTIEFIQQQQQVTELRKQARTEEEGPYVISDDCTGGTPDVRSQCRAEQEKRKQDQAYLDCRAEGIPESDCQQAYPVNSYAPRSCTADDCSCESGYSCRGNNPQCACTKDDVSPGSDGDIFDICDQECRTRDSSDASSCFRTCIDFHTSNALAGFGSCQSYGGSCMPSGELCYGIVYENVGDCGSNQKCCRGGVILVITPTPIMVRSCGSHGTCTSMMKCLLHDGSSEIGANASCNGSANICCTLPQDAVPTISPTVTPTPIPTLTYTNTTLCKPFGDCEADPIGSKAYCDGTNIYKCMPDRKWERVLSSPDPNLFVSALWLSCSNIGDTGVDDFGCHYTCRDYSYEADDPQCSQQKGQVNCYSGSVGVDEDGCDWTCQDGHLVKDAMCSKGTLCKDGRILEVLTNGEAREVGVCSTKCVDNQCVKQVADVAKCAYTGEERLFPDGCVYSCNRATDMRIPQGELKGNILIKDAVTSPGIIWNRTESNTDAQCGFNSSETTKLLTGLNRSDLECQNGNVYRVSRDTGTNQIVGQSKQKSCLSGCRYGACFEPDMGPCVDFRSQFDDKGEIEVCINGQWNKASSVPPVVTGSSGLTVSQKLNLYTAWTILEKGMGDDVFNRQLWLKKIYVADHIIPEDKSTAERVIFDWYSSIPGLIVFHADSLDDNSTTLHELVHAIQNCKPKTFGCTNLLTNWKAVTGWTQPNPTGTGQTNTLPPDLPTNYSRQNPNPQEDMAESLDMYIKQPCILLSKSPRRYTAASDILKNLNAVGCRKDGASNSLISPFSLVPRVYAASGETGNIVFRLQLLTPGKSLKAEVVKEIGEPIKKFTDENKEVYWYPVLDSELFHTIIFHKDIIQFVTIHLPEDSVERIDKTMKPDAITYTYTGINDKAYIGSQAGVAYIADEGGRIKIKQRFIPQPIATFLSKWKAEYPQKYPYTDEGKSLAKSLSAEAEETNIVIPDTIQNPNTIAEYGSWLGRKIGLWIRSFIF